MRVMMCPLWSLLVLGGLAAFARADVRLLNQAIDKVLEECHDEVLRNGNERLRVGDVEDWFAYKYFLVKVDSHLHCWDGWLEDISTLRRMGDVVIENVALNGQAPRDKVKLTVPLKLHKFVLHYNSCRLEMSHFARETEKADFHFDANSLQLNVSLEPAASGGQQCLVQISSLGLSPVSSRLNMDTDSHLLKTTSFWVKEILQDFIDFKVKGTLLKQLEKLLSHYLQISNLCDTIKM